MEEQKRRSTDPRVDQLVEDMHNVKSELAKNTEITTQVRDVLNSFKLIARVCKWLTAVLAFGASVVALVKGITSFHDITPRP